MTSHVHLIFGVKGDIKHSDLIWDFKKFTSKAIINAIKLITTFTTVLPIISQVRVWSMLKFLTFQLVWLDISGLSKCFSTT